MERARAATTGSGRKNAPAAGVVTGGESMSIHRISNHRALGTSSNPYLRYQQALRLSAAAQALYAANHPDPISRTPPQLHERALMQLLELQKVLEGSHLSALA